MHEQTCTKASSAQRYLAQKGYLSFQTLSVDPNFPAFIQECATSRDPEKLNAVISTLRPFVTTHTFHPDLWEMYKTAKQRKAELTAELSSRPVMTFNHLQPGRAQSVQSVLQRKAVSRVKSEVWDVINILMPYVKSHTFQPELWAIYKQAWETIKSF